MKGARNNAPLPLSAPVPLPDVGRCCRYGGDRSVLPGGAAMTEIKHTHGPWQVTNEYDGATLGIANVDGETFSDGTSTFSYDFVCDTLPDDGDGSRWREIAVANGRLIVAPPDLLKAFRALLAMHQPYHNSIEHSAARAA